MYRETENVVIKGLTKRGFRLPTALACNFTVPNTKIFNPINRPSSDFYN